MGRQEGEREGRRLYMRVCNLFVPWLQLQIPTEKRVTFVLWKDLQIVQIPEFIEIWHVNPSVLPRDDPCKDPDLSWGHKKLSTM